MFQHALKSGGFLFLGNSESIGDCSSVFTAEDRKHRIFLRKPAVAAFQEFNAPPNRLQDADSAEPKTTTGSVAVDLGKEVEGILLEHYAPPVLIVDPDLHIVRAEDRPGNQSALAGSERVSHNSGMSGDSIQRVVQPTVTADGEKAPALKFGQPPGHGAVSGADSVPAPHRRFSQSPTASAGGRSAGPYQRTIHGQPDDLRSAAPTAEGIDLPSTENAPTLSDAGWRIARLFSRLEARCSVPP